MNRKAVGGHLLRHNRACLPLIFALRGSQQHGLEQGVFGFDVWLVGI